MQFVWFVGVSGAGKATFICRLVGEPALRALYGIGDTVTYLDARSCPSVDELAGISNFDAVLIKWQFKTHDRLVQLPDRRRDCAHRVLRLRRDYEAVVRDLKRAGRVKTVRSLRDEEARIDAALETLRAYSVTEVSLDSFTP